MRGRDKGLNFDLEVAVTLAEHLFSQAEGADQRVNAGNRLGNALRTLGGREPGTERLEEAAAAYARPLRNALGSACR